MTERNLQKSLIPSEQAMRTAVAARDKAQDGVFVYGVVTTGVYCKPSCKSRQARPDNMRFFDAPHAAETAGFRACKRCRPSATETQAHQVLRALAEHIERHADQQMSLQYLAQQAQMSPSHFQRSFKAALGVSPKEYHDAARMRLLKGGLRSGHSVLDSITAAGFQSTSRVYGHAGRNLGMTPSSYRDGGAGETIAYAFRTTALGPLLLAATDRGVCFAQFGDSCQALVTQLAAEFPKAAITASSMSESPEIDVWIEALEKHLTGDGPRPDVALDLRGTAFQIRVWKFLLSVPSGEVVSYSEVAAGMGQPRATRAAASACGANRIAVLIPCHRVLRGNGELGGYRWGLDRKRALIEQERAQRSKEV